MAGQAINMAMRRMCGVRAGQYICDAAVHEGYFDLWIAVKMRNCVDAAVHEGIVGDSIAGHFWLFWILDSAGKKAACLNCR